MKNKYISNELQNHEYNWLFRHCEKQVKYAWYLANNMTSKAFIITAFRNQTFQEAQRALPWKASILRAPTKNRFLEWEAQLTNSFGNQWYNTLQNCDDTSLRAAIWTHYLHIP